VFGPTGSGKSAVAEALAERLGTAVVSADAMQVYRGLPILTNQPTRPTLLVAIRGLDEEMSVGAYAALAHTEIDTLVAARGIAVVAGGTGLYLRAALVDLRIPPPAPASARKRWEELYDSDRQAAYAELLACDEKAAGVVHVNDRRRVVRALELAEMGSSLIPRDGRLWAGELRHPSLVVGITVPAAELERRIVSRVDAMFAAGVVDEVRRALAGRISRTAEKAVGLQEIACLPPERARTRLIERTRRYAAYQRKWMRRIPGIVPVDGLREPADVAADLAELIRAEETERRS